MAICNYNFISKYNFIKYQVTLNNGIEFNIIDTDGLPVLMTDETKFIGFEIIDSCDVPLLLLITDNTETLCKKKLCIK